MPETRWRKLLLGCVSCMGFNPKHTVKSKQERWQMATSPLLSALFIAMWGMGSDLLVCPACHGGLRHREEKT